MERKIGEIFNYQDNWYQCIENTGYGCINIYINSGSVETGINIYETEEIAKSNASSSSINYLDTIKIEWEE